MRTKPSPPPDYDDSDVPANFVHADDVPCNKIAAAAWMDRVKKGELIVIDGGERPTEVKRISRSRKNS